jgi:Rieske 2Fe-2S family protein
MGRLPERDLGVQAITTCPNFWLEASSDYFVTIRLTPVHAALTAIEMQWFVHPDAVEGRDYQVDRVLGVWKATAEQDFKLCEDNQAGVESSRYKPGPYSEAEGGTETFVQWYVNEMTKKREP